MWFRSVFLKTLRDCRIPILGWGLGLGALAPHHLRQRPHPLGQPGWRASEVLALTRNPVVRLFAEPVDVLSPGGYATWRLSMLLPLLAIWALLAVSRTTRGEEESGALDLLLSVPGSRRRVVVEKLAAIAAALVLIGWLDRRCSRSRAPARRMSSSSRDRALLFGLNTTLFALVFGALALVVSQFTRERRPAAGTTGILLGASFVLTSAGRAVTDGEWIGRLSPLYYFELNKPLVPGYALNVGGPLTDGGARCRLHRDRPDALRPPRHRRAVRAARTLSSSSPAAAHAADAVLVAPIADDTQRSWRGWTRAVVGRRARHATRCC